jgi:hypothetical protein
MKKLTALLALVLAAVSARAIDLNFTWDANGDIVEGYYMYQKTGTNSPVKVAAIPPAAFPTYTLKGVTSAPGTALLFYVTAMNLWGESGASNIVPIAGGPPLPPKNFRRPTPGHGAMFLNMPQQR